MLTVPALLFTASAALLTLGSYIVFTGYSHRRKIYELQKQGMVGQALICQPMPKEWNWLTGHLLVLRKHLKRIPPDAAVMFATTQLAQEYADTEVFLLDLWPIWPAQLILFGPEAITQVCSKYNLPKMGVTARYMRPVAGGPNLVSMNGEEWKYWRSLFNPGFSTGAMLNNVTHVVDSTLRFREKLAERVGKGCFSLDELTTKLATEIILKVTLDDDSNYQTAPNVLIYALRHILAWHSFWDPRVLLNPLRPLVQRYYGNVMNTYIRQELEKRFEELKEAQQQQQQSSKDQDSSTRSVVSLALEAYLAEKQGTRQDRLDDTFAAFATWQVRVFLFAGTDTTASTLVYVYHMLARHPDWLDKLRREHDEIFGRDPGDAADLLKREPALLNKCLKTLAFIKETLRLYAPAGTVRDGIPGASVTDLRGKELPVDYVGVQVLHQMVHRNTRLWPRADEFLPERFLVGQDSELYPEIAALRPFEQGPRNCIGQTLVMNELRVAVILTCRELEMRDAYDELDADRDRKRGVLGRLKLRVLGEPVKTLLGERAYQTDTGGLHPVDGYPCRVSWVPGRER